MEAPVGGISIGQFGSYFSLILVTTTLQFTQPVIFESDWLVYSDELSARVLERVQREGVPRRRRRAAGTARGQERIGQARMRPFLVRFPMIADVHCNTDGVG
ncbi:MAG: hypothetical protein ABJA87_08130 [bacterium]